MPVCASPEVMACTSSWRWGGAAPRAEASKDLRGRALSLSFNKRRTRGGSLHQLPAARQRAMSLSEHVKS